MNYEKVLHLGGVQDFFLPTLFQNLVWMGRNQKTTLQEELNKGEYIYRIGL